MRVKRDDLVWTKTGDEIVVLDLKGSTYLSLNDTAAVLWEALVADATPPGMVAVLREEFDVDADTAEQAVQAFVDNLRRRGLLASDE